jgi:ubiquinone/menaquinone biosynthesis C-methylase UbiE
MSADKNPTIKTYDQVAKEYLKRNQDRAPILDLLNRFTGLVYRQGVSTLPVIDVGCGPGYDAAALCKEGLQCYGLDLSWKMLKTGTEHFGGEYIMADMSRLPFSSGIGGLWCCASLLHLHRQELPLVLEELARILIQNGLLCLSVKEGEGGRWTNSPFGDNAQRYFTYWKQDELDPLIEAAGFRILFSTADKMTEKSVWLSRIASKI